MATPFLGGMAQALGQKIDANEEMNKTRLATMLALLKEGITPSNFTPQTQNLYSGGLAKTLPGIRNEPLPGYQEVLTELGQRFVPSLEGLPSPDVQRQTTPPPGTFELNLPGMPNKYYSKSTQGGIPPKPTQEPGKGMQWILTDVQDKDGKTTGKWVQQKINEGGVSPTQLMATATNLRKEFLTHPTTKSFLDIQDKYFKMQDAYNNSKNLTSNNTLDQALINTFNKILDPQSVVRESEYARTPEGLALLDRAAGIMGKMQKGGAGLTKGERQSLVAMAKVFYDRSQDVYNQNKALYTDLSTSYGIPVERVIPRDYNPTKTIKPDTGNMVKVFDPNGNPGMIPEKQLKDALGQGYKRR